MSRGRRLEAVASAGRLVRGELGAIGPRFGLALALNAAIPPYNFGRTRVRLLQMGGVRLGERSMVGGRLRIAGGSSPSTSITFGPDCFINDGCWFDTSATITVGSDVYFGQEVAVVTSTHRIGPSSRRAYGSVREPVDIGAGSWIGARATILPGVTIGTGAIVAAGSMVNRDVAPDTLVAGVPARLIRTLDPRGEDRQVSPTAATRAPPGSPHTG